MFGIFKRQNKELGDQVKKVYYIDKIKEFNKIKSSIWNCITSKSGDK